MSGTGGRPGDWPDVLPSLPAEKVPAFNRLLGMEEIRAAAGRAEIDVEMSRSFTNRRGVAHGGLVASLLDSVLGTAVVSSLLPEEWCGTVQLNVQFVAPATGRRLRGRGWMVRRGRHLAFAQGEVRDARDELVATAEGTWYVWPRRPDPAGGVG